MIERLRQEFSFIHGNVLVIMTTWAVTDFATLLPDSYYSLYVEALGASALLLGAILSVASFAMAFLQLVGGYWTDRYGRKPLIISMSFGKALIFLIFSTAPTWHFILLGEVLLGISSVSQPALMAIVYDSIPPEKRGLGYSLTMWVGIVSILSPIVAGFLYLICGLVNGMRIAYVVVSACWFVSGLMLLHLTETSKHEANISLGEAVKQYPQALKKCVQVWKFVPRSMLNLLLIFTPATFFIRMCIPYYALYANHFLNVGEFQWAMLHTWESIVFYCAAIPVGKLVDFFGRKKPLVLSSVFSAVGIGLFLSGDLFSLYIFFTFSALCNALIFAAYPALQADLTPKELRGKVIGFTNFVDGFLGSIAMLLGGFLYGSVLPMMPFLLLLISMTATAGATYVFITEPKTMES